MHGLLQTELVEITDFLKPFYEQELEQLTHWDISLKINMNRLTMWDFRILSISCFFYLSINILKEETTIRVQAGKVKKREEREK